LAAVIFQNRFRNNKNVKEPKYKRCLLDGHGLAYRLSYSLHGLFKNQNSLSSLKTYDHAYTIINPGRAGLFLAVF
jgi:hypothetical protein